MGKQQSRNKLIREKRLRRRKAILFVWGKWLGVWNWVKCLTFKKAVILYCLAYVTYYSESVKGFYTQLGIPIPDSVHNTVVTVFLGQLALTAISSLGSRAVEYVQAKFGSNECEVEEDINYG